MAVEPVADDKAQDPNHPEAWGPALLQELIAKGKDGLSDQGKTWAGWAREKFNPGAYLGAGSWNWQHMIGACLLWLDPGLAVGAWGGEPTTVGGWWLKLLQAQGGELPLTGDQDILCRFGGTETLSSTYEPFRAGSINAVRLLALRFPEAQGSAALLTATARYNNLLAALLALGGVPWWDREGHANARGVPYYDGPTISPVGERSTPAHAYQSDLGPFLALAAGFTVTISKREEWPMDVCRQVKRAGGLGVKPEVASACFALGVGAGSLAVLLKTLAGVTLDSRMEWLRHPEGVLVMSGPRLNNNTPKIFWSWADNASQKMAIGFPWQEGKHRGKGASTAAGSCELTTDSEGRPCVIAKAEEGHDAMCPLPASAPLYHVIGDAEGIRLATPPGTPADPIHPSGPPLE